MEGLKRHEETNELPLISRFFDLASMHVQTGFPLLEIPRRYTSDIKTLH